MKNYEGFDGKVVVITGGGSGIGKAICLNLAEQGATVAVTDINLSGAEQTAKEITDANGRAYALQIDITDYDSVKSGFDRILEEYRTIDILINNASRPSIAALPNIFSKNLAEWDDIFETDLRGLVYCVKQIYELMKANRSGKIVNIASLSARIGTPRFPEYGAIKAGVVQFTATLAKDLATYGINVNSICPGLLWTKMGEQSSREIADAYPEEARPAPYEVFTQTVRATIPMQREQTPEDVANLVAFLCSENARNITGQAINVDGGMSFN